MRERREDGEWGFSFTVDHRWRLDHLTNSYHFIPSNPSSLRLSLSISPQCTVVTHEIPLHWCILSLFVTHIQIFFFFFFKGGWSKVVDDNRINMEFILLRGSPGGSIQFPSTAACWFNLFFFQANKSERDFCLSPFKLTFSRPFTFRSPSDANSHLKTARFAPSLRSVSLCDMSAVAAWDIYQALIDFCFAR